MLIKIAERGEAISRQYILTFSVPGKPTNITYKFVECPLNTEYCHLNITWLHPYYQNGTITSFEIILNGTDKRKDAENDKYIHEVYNVENKTYYYDYTYQVSSFNFDSYTVNFRNIPRLIKKYLPAKIFG